MSGPVLYSTNSWFAFHVANTYRSGVHFVWCGEYYDPTTAPRIASAFAVAPSSNPKRIYDTLHEEHLLEDGHSNLIKGYRKTFKRLTKSWLADKSITQTQADEINGLVKSSSRNIWRPVLYVIPRAPIETSGRLVLVPHKHRASYGPEIQIADLRTDEFDVIER